MARARMLYWVDERGLMSPEQCRAARAWLGWSQARLAGLSKVGISTIKNFEADPARTRAHTVMNLRQIFEEAGVFFKFDDDERALGIEVKRRVE
jgi:transcriptional regulator with XRE-family HTH domain